MAGFYQIVIKFFYVYVDKCQLHVLGWCYQQRKVTIMLNTRAALAAIEIAGYVPVDGEITIQCASNPLEFFSAPDWESLSRYAMNYQLCDCGRH